MLHVTPGLFPIGLYGVLPCSARETMGGSCSAKKGKGYVMKGAKKAKKCDRQERVYDPHVSGNVSYGKTLVSPVSHRNTDKIHLHHTLPLGNVRRSLAHACDLMARRASVRQAGYSCSITASASGPDAAERGARRRQNQPRGRYDAADAISRRPAVQAVGHAHD